MTLVPIISQGVFYYHRGRLNTALKPLPCFTEVSGTLMTTTRRIQFKGFGLLGVCRENFLTPSHNKASYVLRETVESDAPKPENLFKKVSELAKEHLSTFVAEELTKVLGQGAPRSSSQLMSREVQRSPAVVLPPGFQKRSTARGDLFYIGPGGKKFRSRVEVQRHLDSHGKRKGKQPSTKNVYCDDDEEDKAAEEAVEPDDEEDEAAEEADRDHGEGPTSLSAGDAEASAGPSQSSNSNAREDSLEVGGQVQVARSDSVHLSSVAPVEMEILKVEVEVEGEGEDAVERLQAEHVHVECDEDAGASDAALRAAHTEAQRVKDEAQARKESEAQKAKDTAQAQKAAEKAAEDAVVEDTWMISVKDGRKGYVVRAGRWGSKQLFQLREQSGSLGAKKYGARSPTRA